MGGRETKFSLSTIITFVGAAAGAVTGAWAFATFAAQHVIDPHIAAARIRVHVMCEMAKVQQENQLKICEATGVPDCRRIDPQVLDASCEEP